MSERNGQEQEGVRDDADRGLPSINKRKSGGGIMQKIAIGVGAVGLILLLIAVNGGFSDGEDAKKTAMSSNDEVGNRLGPAPELPEPPAPPESKDDEPEPEPDIIRTGEVAPPPPQPKFLPAKKPDKDAPPTPEERKATSSLLAFGSVSRSGGSSGGSGNMTMEERARQQALEQTRRNNGGGGGINSIMGSDDAERADGLGANLEPTQVAGARASLIADRNMFITKGTFLDCALETAISSDVPGMTSCRLTRDVYSTSGKVLLLERGSRITGQYQSGMQRGKARIFVLWNRIETPNGVVVNLESPGTDALGRGGHTGYIETHFWERFGGAIMLSLIDDVGTWVANQATSEDDGNDQIQFGSTAEAAQDASSIALKNSINIPPTLLKNQGEHINVFVARDLDFRGVYDLKSQ